MREARFIRRRTDGTLCSGFVVFYWRQRLVFR